MLVVAVVVCSTHDDDGGGGEISEEQIDGQLLCNQRVGSDL